MSRVQTTFYGADVDTQFQWATTGSDLFSRTRDLYYMSQALERHDHSSGRGLPVARIADGSLSAAAYAALSVGTAALANLSVTSGKIAAGAVLRDKIPTPLVQATNDADGGLKLADTTGTYFGSFYAAADGTVVVNTGATSRILINTAGKVVLGTAFTNPLTPALFTVRQTGATAADGFRVYNPTNEAYRIDQYLDGSGIGHIATPTTDIVWSAVGSGIYPQSDMTHVLGNVGNRWHTAYVGTLSATTIAATGTISGASASISGAIAAASASITALSGNTLTLSAGITATTVGLSSSLTCAAIGCTTITCTAINTQNNAVNAGVGTGTFGAINGSGNATVTALISDTLLPVTAGGGSSTNGSVSSPWFNLFATNGYKPGGGDWVALSDDALKVKSSMKTYDRGLKEVLALNPIYYRYNGQFGLPKGREYVGLSAQAVLPIIPEMVGEMDVSDPTDPDTSEMRLTVDPSPLVYMLINAVQDLQQQINELRDRRN